MLIEMLIALAAAPLSDEDLRREVVCAETAFSRSVEQRNLGAFLEFIDPDARFGTRRMARGRDAIASDWAYLFEKSGPSMRWRPRIVEVSSDGMLAISRGPFRSVRTADDGSRVETWGHFISTWRRGADGKWRVLFDTGADFGMQPTDEQRAILLGEPRCPGSDAGE